ncbi:MAG: FAD:protein FMN transferase [Bacillota bacterium]|nr:FAD:protein FMN transferase [Bacillota bacterium]
MQIKKAATLLLLPMFLTLSACAPVNKAYNRQFFTMDTVIDLSVYSDSKSGVKTALDAAEKEFFRIAALCDRFSAGSEVSKINKNAGKEPVKVSDDVFLMISDSLSWANRTGGAFDITVGPLMDLWDFGKEKNSPPSEAEIKKALIKCGYGKVILNKNNKTVFLTQPGMALDLGGIAKGYATDRAASVLRKSGIRSGIINAGGNIFVIGGRPDGQKFMVGVQNPREQGSVIAVLPLSDKAAVSSGDYQRYYIYEGVRYCHILDPKTGYPAKGVTETTVIGGSAEICDILSTSLFVMGREKGYDFASALSEIDGAMFATEDKRIRATPKLKEIMEPEEAGGYITE